jgi:hypothetical protein
VYGIIVTTIKSVVEAIDPLLVPPSIPVRPILTICSSFQSAVAIVQSLSIRRAVRRDNGLTLFVPLLLDCAAKDGRLLREKIASKDTS